MPAVPKHPAVPIEVWRPALDAILAYRAQAPWQWMFDCDISVLIDRAGMPWFAAVLGMAGEVRGLALYRGEQGLRVLQELADGPAELEDPGYRQEALMVWFGAKNDVPPAQRELYSRLGYTPARGLKWAWPAVLDHTCGYVPWGPTAEQVAWLATAVPAVMRFAALVRAQPRLVANRNRFEYPTVPLDGTELQAGSLEWRQWRAGPEPAGGEPVAPDVATGAALRALPVAAHTTLDLDWFFMDQGIAEGERPYRGRLVVVLEPRTAVCLGMEVIPIRDDLAIKAARILAEQLRRNGAVPARVRLRDRELARRLEPWLRSLGSRAELVSRIASVIAFRQAMATFLGR